MPIHARQLRIRNVTFVKRLTVHTSYLALVYHGTNIRFCRPITLLTRYIHVIFTLFIFFTNNALFYVIYNKIYDIHLNAL